MDTKESIIKLENIANKILEAKKASRPRRPIIIEFCGTPKAGKTSCLSSLNIFLKRNGFKTKVLTERASVCPIRDKYNPSFNLWNLFSSSAELLEHFVEKAKEIDVILCDRSIFDCLCWFHWFKKYDHINNEDFNVLESFLTMGKYRTMFDLIYVFKASPKVALDREYANLLTRKTGSIMNKTVLSEYNKCLDTAISIYEDKFRCISKINTNELAQNQVSKGVTEEVLNSLYELVIEKVAYIQRKTLEGYENSNYWKSKEMLNALELEFDYRDKVEERKDLVQPIPIIVLTDENKRKVLVAKKKSGALSEKSPEKNNLLLYFGGHVRAEDKLFEYDSQKTLFTALSREIQEELGIALNISSINREPLFMWLKDNERSEKHLGICFLYKADFEHHKIKLDDYEFIAKSGKSDSGRVVEINDLEIDKFERWSRIILKELLDFEGISGQLDFFK